MDATPVLSRPHGSIITLPVAPSSLGHWLPAPSGNQPASEFSSHLGIRLWPFPFVLADCPGLALRGRSFGAGWLPPGENVEHGDGVEGRYSKPVKPTGFAPPPGLSTAELVLVPHLGPL